MSGRANPVVPFTSSLSGPVEVTETEEREIPLRRRRTVSESAAVTMMRRRHSDFDDSWSRNFEPKEEEVEEEEVGESGAIEDEDLEGIFQFSAESSRSNSESAAAVAGPGDDSEEEEDDCDSVYGDARSRQTSFVRAE